MLLTLLAPLVAGVIAVVVDESKWGKNIFYSFAAGVVLGLITLIALPKGLSFAFGSWLCILLCLAGAAVAYLVDGSTNSK